MTEEHIKNLYDNILFEDRLSISREVIKQYLDYLILECPKIFISKTWISPHSKVFDSNITISLEDIMNDFLALYISPKTLKIYYCLESGASSGYLKDLDDPILQSILEDFK